MRNHHRVHAVRGHLLEMAGDREGAVENYRAAAERTTSLPERNYLLALAARLASSSRGGTEGSLAGWPAP